MEILSDNTELTVALVSILAAIAFGLWSMRKQAGFRRTAQQLRAVSQFRKHLLEAGPNAYLTLYEDGKCVSSEDLKVLVPDLGNCTSKDLVLDFLSGAIFEKDEVSQPLEALEHFDRDSFASGWPVSIEVPEGKIEISGQLVNDPALGPAFILLCFNPLSALAIGRRNATGQRGSDPASSVIEIMIDSLPIPVWRRDELGVLCWVNDAYVRAVEAKDKSTVLSDQIEFLISGKKEEAKKLAKKALVSGKIHRQTGSMVVAGDRRSFRLTEYPALETVGGTFGFALDITKEQELNAEFRRNELSHTETLNSLSTPVAIFGPDQILLFYNNAFQQLWRLSDEWLSAKPSHGDFLEELRERRVLPEQADFPAWKREQLAQYTGALETAESMWHLPSGKALRVVTHPHPWGGLLLLYEDVTDTLALERSYNTMIAVQKHTIDNLHEAVSVIGSDGRVKLFNTNFTRIWQLDRAFLENGPHVSDVFEKCRHLMTDDPDSWPELKAELQNQSLARTPLSRQWRLSNDLFIKFSVVPLPDGASLLAFVDQTDAIKAERALRERAEALETADRLKTRFVSNMSYELRTPLNSIIGFTEILKYEYFGKLNDQQKQYVDGTLRSADELRDLIDTILNLAIIEAGATDLEIEEFKLRPALEQVVTMIQDRAQKKQVTIKMTCSRKASSMCGDQRRIQQAVFNLLADSLSRVPHGGQIRLEAKATKDSIKIIVRDAPDSKQAGRVRSRPDGEFATGLLNIGDQSLGLSLVKSFIELHGGTVESLQDDGPVRVECILPRNTEVQTEGKSDGEAGPVPE